MSLVKWIELPIFNDDRGALVAMEEAMPIPFKIRRVYYMYGTKPAVARGYHAHRKLQQVAVCVAGNCQMVLDDGAQREEVLLNSPSRGLYIGSMLWREMRNFSSDCVLLVLASETYDEDDYIRDYREFLRTLS